MDERSRKAFDFASDLAKQLITLATGILALTITFAKDILLLEEGSRWLVLVAWSFYLLSVVAGVWALAGLTGELQPKQDLGRGPSIRERNVTRPAQVQVVLFLVATLFIVIYGSLAL
jgi:hypothetical protein